MRIAIETIFGGDAGCPAATWMACRNYRARRNTRSRRSCDCQGRSSHHHRSLWLAGKSGSSRSGGRALLDLAALPHVWIKLSAPYRCSQDDLATSPPSEWLKALVQAAPDRCVWGSDWPHTPPVNRKRPKISCCHTATSPMADCSAIFSMPWRRRKSRAAF